MDIDRMDAVAEADRCEDLAEIEVPREQLEEASARQKEPEADQDEDLDKPVEDLMADEPVISPAAVLQVTLPTADRLYT